MWPRAWGRLRLRGRRDAGRACGRTRPELAAGFRTADAVLLSCSGWHTLSVLPDIQQAVGIPVISSNLAVALIATRLAIGAPP
ncbi:hypothetical protein OG762_08725 [Streptomyces sp. NBC_01136]|uniref:aspartate racemase/maleate isomerase family protein n=1 Tax=Streptomyces sp. NBC_01136 TaxID=2903754 RepID=UPI00386B6559|nr:hypothetical protein OG762_08725 [Streptomyces sp. NBC_01136]